MLVSIKKVLIKTFQCFEIFILMAEVNLQNMIIIWNLHSSIISAFTVILEHKSMIYT